MSAKKKILTINQASVQWSRIKGLSARLEKAAQISQELLPERFHFPISATLLLTTDAAIRRLNCDFRGIDKPTNVLSFPQYEPASLRRLKAPKMALEMGDIAIAHQYVVAESRRDNKILINHITHLFIHGLLHLFGYDHVNDPEAVRMERLEKKIMAALDLPDPYAPAHIMEPKRSRTKVNHRRPVARPKK